MNTFINCLKSILLIVGMFGMIGIFNASQVEACNSSPCPPSAPACAKSVAVVKAIGGVFVVPTTGFTLFVPVTVNTSTGAIPSPPCPTNCQNPASLLGGTVVVTLQCPGGNLIGTAPVPPAGPGFNSQTIQVPVFIPAGTVGLCVVVASATVLFSPDSSNPLPQFLTGSGDMVVCFVEPSPANPNIPRLDLQVVGNPTFQCPGGQQQIISYLAINNDPTDTVYLGATATSEQEARMADTTDGNWDFVYSISTPDTGDDFPIVFYEDLNPGDTVPYPPNKATYDQVPINKSGIAIGPGDTMEIQIATTSYGPCGDGSCNQQTMTVEGAFANGDSAFACVSTNVTVNSNAKKIVKSTTNITPTSAVLNWTNAPANVHHYKIRGGIVGTSIVAELYIPGNQNSLFIPGLTTGTDYWWNIEAYYDPFEAFGTGFADEDCEFTPTVPCIEPTPIFTVQLAGNGIRLQWTPVANATGYEIYGKRMNSPAIVTLPIAGGNTDHFDVFGLQGGSAYQWTVVAICGPIRSVIAPIDAFVVPIDIGKAFSKTDNPFDNAATEDVHSSSVKIYPNPANDYFIVSMHSDAGEGDVAVQVFDASGKEIYDSEEVMLSNGGMYIDTKDWSAGLYQVFTTVNGSVHAHKLLVSK